MKELSAPATRCGTLTTTFFFTQPGFELEEIEPHQENDETWRRLHVRFPPGIPTHNNFQTGGEQTFWLQFLHVETMKHRSCAKIRRRVPASEASAT